VDEYPEKVKALIQRYKTTSPGAPPPDLEKEASKIAKKEIEGYLQMQLVRKTQTDKRQSHFDSLKPKQSGPETSNAQPIEEAEPPNL
jgi:hypothetical protein